MVIDNLRMLRIINLGNTPLIVFVINISCEDSIALTKEMILKGYKNRLAIGISSCSDEQAYLNELDKILDTIFNTLKIDSSHKKLVIEKIKEYRETTHT